MKTVEKYGIYNTTTHNIWHNRLFNTKKDAIGYFVKSIDLDNLGLTFDHIKNHTEWDCKKLLVNLK